MEQKKEVVISETSRLQQMWGWWRAKLDLAAQSPWYASYLLRRFYELMKALKPSKQLVASTVTGAALLVGSIAMNPASAQANTIVVNTTNGGNPAAGGGCSLNDAIVVSFLNPTAAVALTNYDCATTGSVGEDTIDLTGVNGTITLTANLVANASGGEHMIFNGPGAANLTIDGVNHTRVTINSPGVGNNVTINGLTITGSGGNGVSASGNVTVNDSTISGSYSNGVEATTGNATVSNSTISGNDGSGVFGGINATVTNSTISGNGSNGVFANNTSVTNSTISGNGSNGVYGRANASVTNSTISGNGTKGTYSGVFAYDDNITVINSTITGNTGPGVFVFNANTGTAVITLNNSLIVGNTGSDVDCSMVGATLTTNGKNLIMTQNGAACTMPTEITALAVAAIMGPLANNGGSTQTHALVAAATNPAVNKGDNADAPGATDQRGQARIQGGTVDIGAFESAFVEVAKAVGGVAEFITPPAVNDGLMWRTLGVMGAGLALGLGVLGLSQGKKTG